MKKSTQRLRRILADRAKRLGTSPDKLDEYPEPAFGDEIEHQMGLDSAEVLRRSQSEHPISVVFPADCLLPYEIDLLNSGHDLHPDRMAHLATCAYCRAIVHRKPEPELVSDFLSRVPAADKSGCALEEWLSTADWSPRYLRILEQPDALHHFADFVRARRDDRPLLTELATRIGRIISEHPSFRVQSPEEEWISEPGLAHNILRLAMLLPRTPALFDALGGLLDRRFSLDQSQQSLFLEALAAQQTDSRFVPMWRDMITSDSPRQSGGDPWLAYRAILRVPVAGPADRLADFNLAGQALALLATSIERKVRRREWRSQFHKALDETHSFGLGAFWFDDPSGHAADRYNWPKWATQCLSVATPQNTVWKPIAYVVLAANPHAHFRRLCDGEVFHFEQTPFVERIVAEVAPRLEGVRDLWDISDDTGARVQAASVLEELAESKTAPPEFRPWLQQASIDLHSESHLAAPELGCA